MRTRNGLAQGLRCAVVLLLLLLLALSSGSRAQQDQAVGTGATVKGKATITIGGVSGSSSSSDNVQQTPARPAALDVLLRLSRLAPAANTSFSGNDSSGSSSADGPAASLPQQQQQQQQQQRASCRLVAADLGPGDGAFSMGLAAAGYRVVAVDTPGPALASLNATAAAARFAGSLTLLPLLSGGSDDEGSGEGSGAEGGKKGASRLAPGGTEMSSSISSSGGGGSKAMNSASALARLVPALSAASVVHVNSRGGWEARLWHQMLQAMVLPQTTATPDHQQQQQQQLGSKPAAPPAVALLTLRSRGARRGRLSSMLQLARAAGYAVALQQQRCCASGQHWLPLQHRQQQQQQQQKGKRLLLLHALPVAADSSGGGGGGVPWCTTNASALAAESLLGVDGQLLLLHETLALRPAFQAGVRDLPPGSPHLPGSPECRQEEGDGGGGGGTVAVAVAAAAPTIMQPASRRV